ncbi:MAG: FAD-dependent oxidoreductase [Planctomycetota bacterium]
MKLVPGESCSDTVTAQVREGADVVVAGGGTAGVVAAIAAARTGAKTLLVERRHFLGGMMTGGNAGLTIYTVYDKRKPEHDKIIARLATHPASVQIVGGIPLEITERLLASGAAVGTSGTAGSYVLTSQTDFKCLLLDMMAESGVRLLLHSAVVDVIKEGDAVQGLAVENKSGRQIVPARIVVDATGDADVAARAGAPFIVGVGPDDPSARSGMPLGHAHGMGFMFRMANVDIERLFAHLHDHPEEFVIQPVALMDIDEAHANVRNHEAACFEIKRVGRYHHVYTSPTPGVLTILCRTVTGCGLDADDLTRGELELTREVREQVAALRDVPGFERAVLMDMPEIGVRETRHIQGEYLLTIQDILERREFPDTIGRGAHPIDIGPLPEEFRKAPTIDQWYFNIPYRSLVPRQVHNLLLAGRCISATHEASGCIRPTVQCMITGQAAGTAAALCVAADVEPRDLDFHRLRTRLAEDGAVL